MKSKLLSAFVIVAGLLAGGSLLSAAEPREVKVTATVAMAFDVKEITAAPGETIKVTLTNTSPIPKMAMGHNWVLLKAGVNVPQFAAAAAAAGLAADFIPANLSSQIIAHTKLLGPNETDSVTFTVPSEPGDYPFICSFTSHYTTMSGILKVAAR